MTAPHKISVIITTYNRPDALEAVVRACFDQSDRGFEIIVTDDGSGEATRACMARLMAESPVPIQHVWQADQGFRLNLARNRGILASSGDYILILDGDCIPQRDYIAQHRRLAEPGFMVTGSRILLSPGFTARALAARSDLHALGVSELLRLRTGGDINKLLQLLVKLPDVGRRKDRFTFRRIKGCNMAMWRADIARVNGFDASFTGWGYDDSDMTLRLFNAGVMRKDGAFATEVFHLWHREAPRDQESGNKQIVLDRVGRKTIAPVRGLDQTGSE
ncbi:MAG: glycosyltransferase family 2 protein [Massilia sp.]